jgi:hypothetical protein
VKLVERVVPNAFSVLRTSRFTGNGGKLKSLAVRDAGSEIRLRTVEIPRAGNG